MEKKAVSPSSQLLREARLAQRWSQQKLADQLGTTMVTISRWENGVSIPSPYYRLKLGQLFGNDFLHFDWLPMEHTRPEDRTSQEEIEAKRTQQEQEDRVPQEEAEVLAQDDRSHPETSASLEMLLKPEEPIVLPAHIQEAQSVPEPHVERVGRRSLLWVLGGTVAILTGGAGWLLHQVVFFPPSNSPAHRSPPTISTQYVSTTAPFMNIAVAWSSHGHFLACAIGDKTVHILEAATGHLLMVYRQHAGFVNDVAWSPDETRVASASGDSTVQVWKASTGERMLSYIGHHGSLFCVNYSHDGTRIASGGRDTTVQIWDAFTAKHLLTYQGHTKGVWNVLWSPDDQSIVSSGEDGTIQIWSPETAVKSKAFTYQGGDSRVNGTDWSPDGTQIVSSHVDATVHIWDALTGSTILTYRGHSASVIFVRWSPDGMAIASGDVNGSVDIWSVSTGKTILRYQKPYEIYALSWAPDSRHLAIASKDGTLDVCRVQW